ncbi:MAG: S9 family peptidase [Deferribacteres bacterium]|nr:S9 family peptidase [Deferribacteres bacterium]
MTAGRLLFSIPVWLFIFNSLPAQTIPQLDIPTIMQNPDTWIGSQPKNPYWSEDSKTIYFKWNPEDADSDSLYAVSINGGSPQKVSLIQQAQLPTQEGEYSLDKKWKVFSKNGDIYLYDIKRSRMHQITNSLDIEKNPHFSSDQKRIIFEKDNALFTWDRQSLELKQLLQLQDKVKPNKEGIPKDLQEKFLRTEELQLMQVLRERKEKQDKRESLREKNANAIPEFYIGDYRIYNMQLSPNEKYVTCNLTSKKQSGKETQIPHFITESGYTETQKAYAKVGSPQEEIKLVCIDIDADTMVFASVDSLPDISNFPEFTYSEKKDGEKRAVNIWGPFWSRKTNKAFVEVRSLDNKDRWLAFLDPATGILKSFEHQHDDAWIAGPGISWWNGVSSQGWLPEDKGIWFCSEESGYSHLYAYYLKTGISEALTSGPFEIYDPIISPDEKYWFFSSNQEHPGERHFYRMKLDGSQKTKLTSMPGRNDGVVSPDGKQVAVLRSFSNEPWELYIQKAQHNTKVKRLTFSTTEQWKKYPWRVPQIVRIPAEDGNQPYARLYKPEKPNSAAVVFVHGAGWFQNAHKWWSSYFREYMFNNLLVDKGYTVLDMDYRGSAGYGRDWRTGIYRHMGGKDLDDHVDAAKWLVTNHAIDANRIGIYGGSYGGFIVLMAQFTKPGVFKSGAALRPVGDWAHYHHTYTSNILNIPQVDSTAYRMSSPIYFVEGLQDHLLMCAGMVDSNVHFQDVVRISQRLIELGKENWDVAFYPMEGHGFREPSSWTDEYRRILKLFEKTLR